MPLACAHGAAASGLAQLRPRLPRAVRPRRQRSHRRQLHLPVRAQGCRGAQAVDRGPQGARGGREDRVPMGRVHHELDDGDVHDAGPCGCCAEVVRRNAAEGTGAVKCLDLIRKWRKHLAIAAAALGEGQIRRARKALTDLTILMLDDKDGGGVVGQCNRSFGRANRDAHGHGHGHHRRSSSGCSSGSGSGSTTGGLASAVYTMGAVLFVVAWALVAAIPCQDRGLQAHLSAPRSFPWSGPVTTLYERILEESKKKERKHSCGLLKEIHQIERCSRQLMEITDASQFPLAEEKDAEVREAAQELVQVCDSLKDGLDPLERQVREMFHRIARTRTDILDSLSRQHNTE